MTDASIIDEKARYIYETHKEEWEKLYSGKIIAIDVEENNLAQLVKTLALSISKPGRSDRVTGSSCAG